MKYLDLSRNTVPYVGGPRSYDRLGACLHTTMGYDSLDWVQRSSWLAGRPASCDFLVPRNGDIIQVSKPGRYAFHTGTAQWGGYDNRRQAVHQVLHGIEFECAEQDGQRITDAQYIGGAALIRALSLYHGYKRTSLTTHAIIALPPGRKTDPRFFDMNVFRRELANPSAEGKLIVFPDVLP